MTDPRLAQELAWQEAAERPPQALQDGTEPAQIERYRRVYRALRAAELPEAAADFAAQVEQAVNAPSRRGSDDSLGRWTLRLGLFGLLVLLAVTLAPYAEGLLQAFRAQPKPGPWMALAASAMAVLVLTIYERVRGNQLAGH